MSDSEPGPVPESKPRSVLVTGAAGYVGRLVVRELASRDEVATVVATDVREPEPRPGVTGRVVDVRSAELGDLVREHQVDTLIHLAAVVTPRPGQTRDDLYSIDVEGTDNVLTAAIEGGATRLVYTSSGAAYGYHDDNPPMLREDDAIRGNEVFAYSWHKRLIEERLERAREEHPELEQVVFRVSTILGPTVSNQITAIFERPVVLGLAGVDTPFCFVSDEDVVACIVRAVLGERTGIYNLTGDGVLTLGEIAALMGRRFVALPERWVQRGLRVLDRLGVAPYGPEQTLFLRCRPVLDNDKLKREFGYHPRWSSREVFETYRASRS